jgi:chemotaxis protein methyltransferase CheR
MSEPLVASALDAVAALVAQRTGLAFPEGRRNALAAAVAEAMARSGASDPEGLLAVLERSPAALDDLVDALTVAESYFFRAPEQFDVLRREVLPEILRRRGPGHRPRFLSAGCASGEEPYSLAILLEEEGLGEQSRVIGVDISRPSLARAGQATYGEWSFRATPEPVRSRYFRREGGRWRLIEQIRRQVEFRHLNLAEDVYPAHATGIAAFDVIFCRNALIYFSPDAIGRIAPRLFATLAEGGWLFPGSADPPLGAHAPFETILTPAGMLYRRLAAEAQAAALQATLEVPERVADAAGAGSEDREPSPRRLAAPGPKRDRSTRSPEAAVSGPGAAALHVRTIADAGRIAEALEAASSAVRAFPDSAEIWYLHAVLLAEAGQDREASEAFRRALYLDGSLAVAALALGLTLRRLGDLAGTARALRRARSLLAGRPADEPVALADGERAGRLLATVDVQIGLLEVAA